MDVELDSSRFKLRFDYILHIVHTFS